MQKNRLFDTLFARRSAICMFILFSFFLASGLRLAAVATGEYGELQREQSCVRLQLSQCRGTIFDCNMVPLTNNEGYTVAALNPTAAAIEALKTKGINSEEAVEVLNSGKPAVCELKGETDVMGVVEAKLYRTRTGDTPSRHLVGYTDSSGHGVSGLEAAYDELLYIQNQPYAEFTVDGKGRVLCGIAPEISGDITPFDNGVISTVDVNIQGIAEEAASGLTSGAVLVCEAASGKIRATLSKPNFDPDDISESLTLQNSPLMDKTLAAFSVGSVFKPCVAAAAIESGKDGLLYTCVGSEKILDRNFNCHKREGHGALDLRGGLAQSCNTYFYNLALAVGGEKIYKIASSLNFGAAFSVADGVRCAAGSLTRPSALKNPSSLANFSIGQGSISLSPMALCNLYCAIANGGEYRLPSVVEGTVSDGVVAKQKEAAPTRVMSKATAERLKTDLSFVISEGTGTAAAPKNTTAAGKTATAQTGRYRKNGTEITNSWFCGMFPLESPKYVVVVMSNDQSELSTAELFAKIADGITELEKGK